MKTKQIIREKIKLAGVQLSSCRKINPFLGESWKELRSSILYPVYFVLVHTARGSEPSDVHLNAICE